MNYCYGYVYILKQENNVYKHKIVRLDEGKHMGYTVIYVRYTWMNWRLCTAEAASASAAAAATQ